MNKHPKILIVRTDRIGDVVLTLPMASVIKKNLPESYVAFLSRKYTAPLTEKHPFIDSQLITYEKNKRIKFFKNIKLIRQFNFDIAFIVSPSFLVALIIFLSGIKTRIATGYRWYSFLFNRKVYEHRKTAAKHELEYNISMLSQIDINADPEPGNVNFGLSPDFAVQERIKKLLEKNGVLLNKILVVIHPGSGGSAIDLPVNSFARLTELISRLPDVEIVLTGSKEEKDICHKLSLNNKIINLAGALNLNELIALINLSGLFISNSTGPIHIAAALNKYTIGFYPKIVSCSARRWGPYSQNTTIFSPSLDCYNCIREQCQQLNCMNSIDIDDVFVNVEKICKFILNNGANNAEK